MRSFIWIAIGVLLLHSSASAQTATADIAAAAVPTLDNPSDSGATPRTVKPEFVPLTSSERARRYLKNAFGPGAILRAAAAGGIAQWEGTPKEWKGGAEAYGDRFGNALAKHVIREALEFGGATALHEDNRYVRSLDSGFFKRTKHAVTSVFVARNDAGQEHFAYSRFGSVLGSSFISRLWQPPSEDGSGDALVSFGFTMVTDMGWNVFKEFGPSLRNHFRKQ
jgi:hypothetical protein